VYGGPVLEIRNYLPVENPLKLEPWCDKALKWQWFRLQWAVLSNRKPPIFNHKSTHTVMISFSLCPTWVSILAV
jgi:hypothetical protein